MHMNGSSSVIGIGPGQSLQQRDNYLANKYCGSLQRPNNSTSIQTNIHPNPHGASAKTLPHNPHLNRVNNQSQPNSMYSFNSSLVHPNTDQQPGVNTNTLVKNTSSSQTPTPPPPVVTVQQLPTSKSMATTFSGMGTHVWNCLKFLLKNAICNIMNVQMILGLMLWQGYRSDNYALEN